MIMPSVSFSPNIRSHIDLESTHVSGKTVKEALEVVFQQQPRLRSYLFDDDGTVRKHIAIILNSQPVKDRTCLSDLVGEMDEIFVMQALSGG